MTSRSGNAYHNVGGKAENSIKKWETKTSRGFEL